MTLDEINRYLDKPITQELFTLIEPAYYVMDFPYKKQFAIVVNAVGIDALIMQRQHYDMLLEDKINGDKKRRYESHIAMKEQLKIEQDKLQQKMKRLNKEISAYEHENGNRNNRRVKGAEVDE